MLLGGWACSVWAGPSPEAVRAAADALGRLEKDFLVQTASARLTFVCLGHFANEEQKKVLAESASGAVRRLGEILSVLTEHSRQMETYTGSDWDTLYGQTGIWSAAQQGLLKGRYLEAFFLFWSAVCEEGPAKQQTLGRVIECCRAESARWGGQEQLLEVYARWQRQGPDDAEQMRMLLHQMMLRDDLSESSRERMLLLQKRFELFAGGPFEEQVAELFERKIAAQEDFEWALEYAFFEWMHGRPEPLKQVGRTWPSSESFLAGLMSEWESERFDTVQRPAWEAQMQQFSVRASRSRDPNEQEAVEQQWIQWIRSLDKSRPEVSAFRRQAAAGYVHYLFNRTNEQNLEKIVRFLEGEDCDSDPVLGYLYVQALVLQKHYSRAVSALCRIPADCRNAGFDLYVLEEFADRLEEYCGVSGLELVPLVMNRADQIAACEGAKLPERKRAQLLWAEMASRSSSLPASEETRLDQFLDEQKDSLDEPVIRCIAFRRMQQGQWAQAVKEWQRVRSAFEPSDRSRKERSWYWWRAKYYELHCSAQLSESSREDVRHAVRILRTLYTPPPPVWQARLDELDK
jgi:hypothetical protein